MSTDPTFIEKILERLAPTNVSSRPMVGEYGLYDKGKNFALVCNDTLYIKMTDAGRGIAGRVTQEAPYIGAKPAFKISSAKLGDHAWVTHLIEVTSVGLSTPKAKKKRPR